MIKKSDTWEATLLVLADALGKRDTSLMMGSS